ncbi:MAG: 50S ribosomal protein L25 [Thermoguttaceae bacterium]|nr:50S ribosomal protein L25 [Thermoguttaceae bacterium]
MAEQLTVQIRETRGTRRSRRLRDSGKIPAVLYGHKQETVWLTLPAEQLDAAVRHGARLVQLSGAVSEQAFIRELQWDTWGKQILHVDLARISAHEKVKVTVPVELRGMAPGVKEGGVIEHQLHEVEIECEATEIPERLAVNINHLGLNESITADQIELPPTARLLIDADSVVVQCVVPTEAPEVEEPAAGEAEPEVIRRRPEVEGEEGEE